MAGEKARGGRKNRKYGRNKKFCERYTIENTRIRNKRVKLKRHLRRQPNDKQAATALQNL